MYAEGHPFTETRDLIAASIQAYSSRPVKIHSYNAASLAELPEYNKLVSFIRPPSDTCLYSRGGFFNLWKPLIVADVYRDMHDGDVLYYVDCSRYFIAPFIHPVDRLVDVCLKLGHVAGSVSTNVSQNTIGCCNNNIVWSAIMDGGGGGGGGGGSSWNPAILSTMHVLNSWFMFTHGAPGIECFIREWVEYSFMVIPAISPYPLGIYHHTVDQSIFNVLVYKYNMNVFFTESILHNDNKNKNQVLMLINQVDSGAVLNYFRQVGQLPLASGED